ncbi:MAG: Trm112 family protein [candidate division WOR-3 bacterium]
MIDKRLLDILICPKCKGELIYDEERDILICKKDNIYFEIKNNIPVMLIEKAKKLDEK